MGRQEKDDQLLTAGNRCAGSVLRQDRENGNRGDTGGVETLLERARRFAGVIDPFKLPSLPLSLYKGLPSCAGVYFAIADNQILYIGESIDIAHRWQRHHRRQQLFQCGEVCIAWQECAKDKQWLIAVQDELIAIHSPPLNGTVSKFVCQLSDRPWHAFPDAFRRKPQQDSPDRKRIEWHLQSVMKSKGLTNKEVANRMKLLTNRRHHANTISRWKLADKMPKLDGRDLGGLVSALECSLDDLLGKE